MRSYDNAGVPEAVRAAGGEIFAVTSEPQSLASNAGETWSLGFSSIGDPHHEIRSVCRERGWLDLFTNPNTGLLDAAVGTSHPNGYFQPGVLALTSEGRVLYRWRCRPTRSNVGGAIERPTAEHVWAETASRLASTESGDDVAEGDAPLDDAPPLDMKGPPWPLFVLFLLANGWFLKPRPFPLIEGRPVTTPPQMIPRLLGFLALWAAAFWFLPNGAVALALLAWLVIVTPGLRVLHREFQHAPDGEPAVG